jgi:hypothetical protein
VKEVLPIHAPNGVGAWSEGGDEVGVSWNFRAGRFHDKNPEKAAAPEVGTRMLLHVSGGADVADLIARSYTTHGYPSFVTVTPTSTTVSVDVEVGVGD